MLYIHFILDIWRDFMNTKRLITASIFSLISASTALAADVLIPHQTAPSTPSSAIVAPAFSWTGLYLGIQAGGFSSKADMALIGQEKSFPLDKEFSPKLSGFAGGFYGGSNIDLGDSFIFGVDTDLTLSGKKHTKTITIGTAENVTVENAVGRSRRSAAPTLPSPTTGPSTQTLSTSTTGQPTSTQTAASKQPAPAVLPTSASGGSEASQPTVSKPTASGPAASQPSQAADRQVNLIPQPNAGAGQSSQSAATGNSGNVNSTTPGGTGATLAGGAATQSNQAQARSVSLVQQLQGRSDQSTTNGLKPSALKSVSSTTEANSPERSTLSSARSDTGKQASGVGASESGSVVAKQVSIKSAVPATQPAAAASGKVVAEKAASSASSTQPSAAERTVPSGNLLLARSGSSNSGTGASSGASGAKNGAHHSSSHGSANNANPHGASHPGGHHGSGANPHGSHGTHPHVSRPHGVQSQQAADKDNTSVYGIEQMKKMASEFGLNQEDEVETVNHTFKQNWGGATRVRIGFAADRFMPYLAGGIAYGQFQDTVSISVKGEDGSVASSRNLTDETKTMIGYTLGGGVDFSVLDNVIVRAEYRYSDFGKKKFAKEKLEVSYKTNDFRVGVAYKF